jgi:UDP-N-acetylmuramate--alanine ligase
MDWCGRRLHFVGVGGCGMSGLALVAHRLGAEVSGSDVAEGAYLPRLRAAGIPVAVPHNADAVPTWGEVVVSSAIPPTNPERERAANLGLREVGRGALLAELVAQRPSVVVAGTHGKTTTTAMIVHCLSAAGRDVGYLVGGDLLDGRGNAAWGASAEWLVVESDESDGSAMLLTPTVLAVTNVDHDHVVAFPTVAEVAAFFDGLAARTSGAVIRGAPVVEARLDPWWSRFTWRGTAVRVPVPGAHNVANATVALEACWVTGLEPEAAARALSTFPGTRRRIQHLGRAPGGALVVDDYGHHPTAIAATFDTLRLQDPDRLVAVFEPWGLARSQHLLDRFVGVLAGAHEVLLLPHLGRVPDLDLEVQVRRSLATEVAAAGGSLRPVDGGDEVARALARWDEPGTTWVFLGCGPIDRLAASFVG